MSHKVDITYSGTPMSALFGERNEAGELVSVRAIVPVAVWLTHTTTEQMPPGTVFVHGHDKSLTRVIGMVPHEFGLRDAKQIPDFVTFLPSSMSDVPASGLIDYLQRQNPVK